jgi:hypothetical protein
MTIWVVVFHNSSMPRFCYTLCSLHETEASAMRERDVHNIDELSPQQRKGARWLVERWVTTPKDYVPTNKIFPRSTT